MKRNKMLLFPAVFAISSLVGCGGGDVDNTPKHVQLGMSKVQVMNTIGDPNLTKNGKWYYFDSSFYSKYTLMNELINSTNEAERIRGQALKEELTQMHFVYRYIEFSDEVVNKYFYDVDHSYNFYNEYDDFSTWTVKTQSEAKLSDSSSLRCYRESNYLRPSPETTFSSEVKYSDGSIYISYLTGSDLIVNESDSKYKAYWELSSKVKGFVDVQNVIIYDGYVWAKPEDQLSKRLVSSIGGSGFYNEGNEVNLTASIQGNGYEIDGWFLNKQKLSSNSFEFAGSGLKEIYLKIKISTYNITYNLDGGTNNPSNPSQYNVEEVVRFYDPQKEGFVFVGWFDSEGNKVEYIFHHTLYGDLVLTAKWEAATLKTIYLNYDGAVLFEGTSAYQEGYLDYPYGEPTKPDTEDKVYEFVQWTKVSEVNYTVTYKAEYEEYSKDEMLQQYIASMNLKIKQRTEFVKAANETREVSAIQLLCFELSNVGSYVLVEFDVDFDGETGWNHSAWFKIELSEDDYRDLSDILYNADIISTDSPITENYTFDEIRGIYNIIFKGKDLVTTDANLDGSPWKMHYPEIPDEVRFDINEIQDKCFNISAGYTTIDGEMVLITEYSLNDYFLVKSATIVKYSYKDYLAVEGKVRLGVRDEQSNMVYEEATLKVVLKVEATRLAKFAQYTEDVGLVGETLIENYDPVQIMYLNNCVMHNETTGYKYYLNDKSFTPEDY